ncbi:lipoamide acyltransferase component of branched-chain alpha-keto acid dehydrogenase complex, mitochondrial [Aristolochia californica]|uniref:lipoamide acyltransferase component of branched-chain alpha-keto acid dehydrogenase complex, mitochondrial n=1 Tax=Aristolochia californica TaxID=171875 RepID=UPI0035DCD87D
MTWRRFRPWAASNSIGRRVRPSISSHAARAASAWEPRPPTRGLVTRLPFSPFHVPTSNVFPARFDINYPCMSPRSYFSTETWIRPPTEEIVEVPLAQTGEGIAECELLKWFVQEGDQVEEFQRLCEVQSDKATIEITSRFGGKVHQILYVPGDTIKVGDTILKILTTGSETTSSSDSSDDSSFEISELSEPSSRSPPLNNDYIKKVLSTPSVRALAKQYGLDINNIKGTGKDGRVLQEDVLEYAANRGICKEPSGFSQVSPEIHEMQSLLKGVREQSYEDRTVLLRGFQRAMVKSMSMAAKIPHFYYLEEINCNKLMKLKAAFQSETTDAEVKITYLPFLIKSLSMALDKYPILNSAFIESSNEVILKGSHNIGVAMATPYGLVVPNIKKVQSLNILEITKELARLQQMASNNKLNSEDVSGGTITISNIGAIGGKFGCPLVNLPEVAIIAVGRIQKVPHFDDDGAVVPAAIANVVVGADHRIVDGATVARFCNEWKLMVEKPELLLLRMR